MTNTELIKQEIERRIREMYSAPSAYSALNTCKGLLSFIDSLPKESAIKVYRVENEKEQKGLWRKFDGTWEPLFDMLTDGQCKDMPMEDSPIYREGGKQWFASAPSKETLQKWFSKKDLEELTNKGFTVSEFTVCEYKQLTEFEYIFTRDSIVARNYLKVEDIYPPKNELEEEYKRFPLSDHPTQLDEIDQWLADNFGIMPRACASTENLRHNTARMIAEALWPKCKETLHIPEICKENGGTFTCKSCKNRYDDHHLYFPDCFDGHREENKKEGKDCPFYQLDESIL